MYLQKNMKYLKERSGLSFEKLSSESGVSAKSLYTLVHTDGKNITVQTMVRISKYFKYSIDDLIYTDITHKK